MPPDQQLLNRLDARLSSLPADPRMPRGARVNVILPPLSLTGPTVTIRLFPQAISLSKLNIMPTRPIRVSFSMASWLMPISCNFCMSCCI